VSGHALATEEDLHGGRCEACPDVMTDESVRDAVVVPVDIDVVVEGDGAFLPLGINVGIGGQRSHRWTIERLVHTAPRPGQALERTFIELNQQRADRRVELLQAKEALLSFGRYGRAGIITAP